MKNFIQKLIDVKNSDYSGAADEALILLGDALFVRRTLGGKAADDETVRSALLQNNEAESSLRQSDLRDFAEFYDAVRNIESEQIFDALDRILDRGDIRVPAALLGLMIKDIGSGIKNILVIDPELYGSALRKTVSAHPEIRFTLAAQNTAVAGIIESAFDGCGNVSVISVDLCCDARPEKYDMILSVQIYTDIVHRRFKTLDGITGSIETVKKLLDMLSENGILKIVTSNAVLNSTGRTNTELRTRIIDHHKLIEIDALPARTFLETAVPTVMLTVSLGKTEDVIVKTYLRNTPAHRSAPCAVLTENNTGIIKSGTIPSEDRWNVELMFTPESGAYRAYLNAPIEKISLGETAELFRGSTLVSDIGNNRSVGVIGNSAIGENGIYENGIKYIADNPRVMNERRLTDGDLLLTAAGSDIRSAVFHTPENKSDDTKYYIAARTVIVIHPNDKSSGAAFLHIFFSSPAGRHILALLSSGSIVPKINIDDIADIRIPRISRGRQTEIITAWNKARERYRQLTDDALRTWNEEKDRIYSSLTE